MKKTIGEKIFTGANGLLLLLVSAAVLVPLMHIFSVSVSDSAAVTSLSVGIWPSGFSMRAYSDLLSKSLFVTSFINTVTLTAAYTCIALILNMLAAFGFSKPFYGKRALTYVYVITMYFGGGLIPTYMLVANTLNLYNNYLAFLLPGIVSVFYIVIMRSQIEALPPSLSEAAQIDGANEFQLLFHIIIPSIKSTLAAIGMFLALGMWNMWYSVLLYSNRESMWTLQYLLRSIVFEKLLESRFGNAAGSAVSAQGIGNEDISPYNYQMAAIISVAAPIVCIYPFVQKYFVKGILVGSVKE